MVNTDSKSVKKIKERQRLSINLKFLWSESWIRGSFIRPWIQCCCFCSAISSWSGDIESSGLVHHVIPKWCPKPKQMNLKKILTPFRCDREENRLLINSKPSPINIWFWSSWPGQLFFHKWKIKPRTQFDQNFFRMRS